MSDIPIIFETNASTVTREVTSAEHATTAAAKATVALDKAVASIEKRLGGEAKALKGAAAAAAEYSRALKSSQNALTGAPGRSRGNGPNQDLLDSSKAAARRTNIQRALAQENRAIRAEMEKGGAEAGGSFGSGMRRTLERMLNRPGFFGAKDSLVSKMFGGGSGGAGMAASIAVGAGFTAAAAAVRLVGELVDQNVAKLTRASAGAANYASNLREAARLNRDAGVSAAQAHGGSILAVTANGGQAALDTVRTAARNAGTNENDAASAYQALYSRFAGNQSAISSGLGIAADVSKVTGQSLNDTVATLGLQEIGDKGKARDRLTALAQGHITVKPGDYDAAVANVGSSGDAGKVQSIRGSLATGDINADRTLGAGTIGAMDAAGAAADPGGKYLADISNANARQVKLLSGIHDKMSSFEKAWQFFTTRNTVTNQLTHAQDDAALAGGAGAAP